ncbi:MAG: carotenoid biosynthesis protein [Thermomicrobiales bacterium]|nr:carotenoid biosynthesis protein [Thermomicrobiales bacterium]
MKRLDRWALVWSMLAAHLIALVFGLIGILIMLPHPELWADDPRAVRVFDWSMAHAGATHIILGASTMATFGVIVLGWRRTAVFGGISIVFSLASELFGTGTGWPFGNYEYTSFLGYKVLGRVPWTIPLSWFYMGLASYLLGMWLTNRLGLAQSGRWGVLLGAWMLTAWDLVLDPAMAHHSLHVQFWIWDEQGPYFGMPIKNFVGWTVTGLAFMAVSRLIWQGNVVLSEHKLRLPLVVYGANMIFAMVISAAVGLWQPIVLAMVVAITPFALSAIERRPRSGHAGLTSER